jgi:HEPN domain-containing protein
MADEDLAGARMLVGSLPRLARYHVQQSAEKAVKALLEHRGLNPGREHRFEILAEMLARGDPWRERIAKLHPLSPVATSLRYPTAEGRVLPRPTHELVDREIASTAQLITDVRRDTATAAPNRAVTPGSSLSAKDALIARIVEAARRRGLEMPDKVEEKLATYAEEADLRMMVADVETAASFQDMLDAHSIIIPKHGET